ncbi:MAG: hypothetical protein ACK5K7_00235 [Bacilli bacterium]
MDSILTTTKKLLGIGEEDTHFDLDIIVYINTAISILTQIGVGPPEGFSIIDNTSTWSDFTEDKKSFESVKTFIYLKVKLLFDPPANSNAIESINSTLNELQCRLSIAAESEVIK